MCVCVYMRIRSPSSIPVIGFFPPVLGASPVCSPLGNKALNRRNPEGLKLVQSSAEDIEDGIRVHGDVVEKEYRKQEQIPRGMIMSFTMNMQSLKYLYIHGAVSIGSLKFGYGETQAKD